MTQEARTRLIAGGCTAIIAAALLIMLMCGTLGFARQEPPVVFSEIVMEPEEYIEVADDYLASAIDGEETPRADDSRREENADGVDQGGVSDKDVPTDAPAAPVTAKEPSPVKEKKQDDAGSAQQRREQEERRQQRAEAEADVAGAFGQSGRGSAAASNQSSDGNNPLGTVHGTGTGKIGKGWGLPGFGRPVCKSTGTIIIEARIDKDGRVTSVSQVSSVSINGRQFTSKAPASTDAAAIAACKADVQSRTFPRTGTNDGQGTTAYIAYTFQ